MNKEFEKIIEKQKELFQDLNVIEVLSHVDFDSTIQNSLENFLKAITNEAIEIVKQEAEKFGTDTNVGSNGWIPCSERLPKYGEVVMCSCTNSGITISCITHKGVKPSKSVRFGQHSVIAWQPLPKPYKESD